MARPDADLVIRLYEQAQTIRSPNENDYRMASAYCLPSHYSAWQTTGPATYHNAGAATRRIQYDTTGARSLSKYAAVLERIATPIGQKWHGLMASDMSLRKKMRVRLYFDEVQERLFKYRYNPRAGFRTATSEMYMQMGVYGNGPIFIGQSRKTPLNKVNGFRYVSVPFRDVFVIIDDEGEVVGVFRRFWLNVRQFQTKFPDEPLPASMAPLKDQAATNENQMFEFVHYVHVRGADYDPQAIDARRHPIVGSYVSVKDRAYVGKENGYRSFPYKMPRTMTISGNPYGIAPAAVVLAAMGGASEVKKTYIKQGQKAVDPVLLAFDDGVLNGEVDLRPGAVNPGGVNKDGKLMIQRLPTGDFRIAEVLLQDEREDIKDSFFVTLFDILTENPEMTATQVIERIAEKASLLSPTMGRLQSEFLGPDIEREIDMLDEMGQLPEMPPELVEAAGEYEVVYTSPMAKGQYAEEVAGFNRSVELALGIANVTQDPAPLDHFDFDAAIPEISDYMAVPARWMNDEKVVKSKREQRASQQQEQQLIENAGPLAGAAKAVTEMQNPRKAA